MMIRRPTPNNSMTLVELMVSIALGVIIIGIMVSVWTTSSDVVSQTKAKIRTYQSLRLVLDQIERDIANVVRTTDMEFFEDKNSSGHYDAGEEYGMNHASGYLRFDDMFHKDDGAGDLGSEKYFFAPTLYTPKTYPEVPGWDNTTDDDNGGHRRDEFYFRTFSRVDGENRSCMIHYRLKLDPDAPQNPVLIRRLSYIDRSNSTPRVIKRESQLAEGVTDLEFDMFYKESRIFDRGHFFDAREARENIPALANQFSDTAVQLVYSGEGSKKGKIEWTRENGVWLRPSDEDDDFQFGAVRPGDRFLIFDAEDDDEEGNNTKLKQAFGNRYLTVAQIIALQPNEITDLGDVNSKIFVKFVENIDFIGLAGGLLPESPITVREFDDDALKRTIFQSFNASYRVGFLPGAFRVRFKFRDPRTRRLVPFERVVRVLNS